MADVDSVVQQSAVPSRKRLAPTRSKQVLRLGLYLELLVLDCVAIGAAFMIAEQVRGAAWMSPDGVRLIFLVLPVYVISALNRSAYSIQVLRSRADSIQRALTSLVIAMLIILTLGYFAQAGESVSRAAFLVGSAGSAVLLIAGRYGFHRYAMMRSSHSLTDELLIVDGVDMPTHAFRHVIDAQAEHIQPDLANPQMLGRLAALLRHYDRVVVAAVPERQHGWSLLLKGANLSGELIMQQGNDLGAIGISRFHDHDTLQISRGPLSITNRAKKRALDLAITVPLLIFLAPLFALIALAIRLETAGPIFFRQPRVGRGNAMFEVLKFRSMRNELSDAAGNRSASRDDDRITRVGRFIRKTSIDELPQLINVLRGDMSLVGPRPHALGSLAGNKLFWEVNERYWLRHALKPGITGLAQIRGFRGATHHQEDLQKRLRADLEYLSGWRLWRDVTILFGTIKVMVHDNAY